MVRAYQGRRQPQFKPPYIGFTAWRGWGIEWGVNNTERLVIELLREELLKHDVNPDNVCVDEYGVRLVWVRPAKPARQVLILPTEGLPDDMREWKSLQIETAPAEPERVIERVVSWRTVLDWSEPMLRRERADPFAVLADAAWDAEAASYVLRAMATYPDLRDWEAVAAQQKAYVPSTPWFVPMCVQAQIQAQAPFPVLYDGVLQDANHED